MIKRLATDARKDLETFLQGEGVPRSAHQSGQGLAR